jgi:hypothetical protein
LEVRSSHCEEYRAHGFIALAEPRMTVREAIAASTAHTPSARFIERSLRSSGGCVCSHESRERVGHWYHGNSAKSCVLAHQRIGL